MNTGNCFPEEGWGNGHRGGLRQLCSGWERMWGRVCMEEGCELDGALQCRRKCQFHLWVRLFSFTSFLSFSPLFLSLLSSGWSGPSVLDVPTQIPQNILLVRVLFYPLRVTLGVGGIIHPQRQFDFLLFASHFPEYSPFSAYFPSPSSHAHLNFIIFKFSGSVSFVLWRCSYFPIFYFHGSR